jgi:hypothetical protein
MSGVKDVVETHEKEAVTAEDNAKLEEMLRGYRVVYFNEDHFLARRHKISSIRIYDKSVLALSRYGDEMLTRTRNRLMKDPDMLTYEEQMRYLEERGLWDDEKEKDLFDLRNKAREMQEDRDKILSKLQSARTKETKEKYKKEEMDLVKLFQEVYIKYAELTQLNLQYFQDTIEMQAQTAQRKGHTVSCVCADKKEDVEYNPDSRIWKSVEALEKDLSIENLEAILNECVMFWEFSGKVGDSFFAESPEGLTSDSSSKVQKS